MTAEVMNIEAKHAKWAQRLPAQSLMRQNFQKLPSLVSWPNGRRWNYTSRYTEFGSTTVNAIPEQNRAGNILVRIKDNTVLRLEYRRLKDVAQAVIKNAARDHFLFWGLW